MAASDLGADAFGERDAVGHRCPRQRHERHDIDGADARMSARMPSQIDPFDRTGEQCEHGGFDGLRLVDECVDRSVMFGIGADVEQSRRRSAVYDALTNPTPVVIDVVTG